MPRHPILAQRPTAPYARCSAECATLNRTRRVGLGIEVEDEGPAAKVAQRDLLPVLVWERELGRLLAGFDHPRDSTVTTMDPWVRAAAAEIGKRAVRELEALVGVSSPSGDIHGAEECAAVCAALLPEEAQIERIPCSSPDHAPDLLARLRGTGARRVLLLGHLDTVIAHEVHRPLTRQDDKLVGSGAVDMKGGDVLAIGVMRALAKRPEAYAEVALLLVCDEE